MEKLYHEDCINQLSNISTNSVELLLSDPPFSTNGHQTTGNSWDVEFDIDRFFNEAFRVLKPNAPLVCFANTRLAAEMLQHVGKHFRHQWYWHKNQAGNFMRAQKQPLARIEQILVFSNETNPNYFPIMTDAEEYKRNCKVHSGENFKSNLESHKRSSSQRYPTDVLTFAKPPQQHRLHPTEKPIALLEYLIQTYTKVGDTVLDTFAGSGSTLLAARNLGRNFIGIEKEDKYIQVCESRLNISREPVLVSV